MHSMNFTHFNVLSSWRTFVYHSCIAYLPYIGMIFRVNMFFSLDLPDMFHQTV